MNIKPHDLRVGNLFEYFVEDSIGGNDWVLNVIDWEDIKFCSENNGQFNKYYRPIELTGKLLEKINLKKQNYEMSGCSVFTTHIGWRIAHNYRDGINEFKLWHTQVSPPTWSLLEVKYVHEVQNIIYDLTKTELTIKL